MSEALWFLKRCPLFESLTPEECQRVEGRSRSRSYAKNEIIYIPDEPGDNVLLLTRGRVKIVSLTPDGHESIIAFIEPGELFGELALVDRSPRNEQAEAVEPSQLLAIPRDEILRLMDQRTELSLSVVKWIGFRLRRIENRLKTILFRSSRERTVSILLELVSRYGRADGPHWEIGIQLSHQDLANLLGMTRETVSLSLGQLQRDGLIELNRLRIIIKDLRKLKTESLATGDDSLTSKLKPLT